MDIVWILGCRGSVSSPSPDCMRYGGATTSVLVFLDGQYIILDAGTGLLNLPKEAMALAELPLLLSHLHLDHIAALPMCPYLFRPQAHLSVYAARHEGYEAREAIAKLFAPPFWPVTLEALPGSISYHPVHDSFFIGSVRVDMMPGVHPNGVSIFRLTGGERSIVFVSDCTLSDELLPTLTDFARGCDLLLCDGQYSEEEWASRSNFGHSTWTAAAMLAEACGAKQYRVIHHDPTHNDDMLDSAEEEVRQICPRGGLAKQGEEILL